MIVASCLMTTEIPSAVFTCIQRSNGKARHITWEHSNGPRPSL